MNLREEKKVQIMNYCWLNNKAGVEPLLAAYLLGKTDGKKEAVERLEEKLHTAGRIATIETLKELADGILDQRKKEMLEPLSTNQKE